MAKGPGGTRSGNSGNPQGNGTTAQRRVDTRPMRERIAEARDELISLEYQRDQLRQNGGSSAEIARMTQEIDDRRMAIEVAERENQRYERYKQDLDRRINASWSQFKLGSLDKQVKGLSLVQEFSLEPADNELDYGGYTLEYSSYLNKYMIRRREGGRTTTVAESPAIGDLVRKAKKLGLVPVGVKGRPGTSGM